MSQIEIQDTIALTTDTLPGIIPDTLLIRADPSGGDSIFFQQVISPDGSYPAPLIINQLPGENIPYFISDTLKIYQQNQSLRNFSNHYFSIKETSELIYKEESKPSESIIPAQLNQKQNLNRILNQDINPDWLIFIIIGSLVILAWLKLFFNKFFDQIIVSMWNFQLGSKFLRDQGIFSRRVGLVLNINFLLIGGLFIYLVLTHFNINPLSLEPFYTYILYTSILTILLLIRYILTTLTGYIFNQQVYFREYLYHILIIYKNLGIFFIPIVFCIAYIQENLRIYVIICALVLIALAYLLRFIKGFQLIIKKDVLIFYLILYLCTLEILPVLFYYKFFSGWIK